MGRGSSKAGAAKAGGSAASTNAKADFIERVAQSMANPYSDETPISNSDMQGMVESYALTNGLSFQEENEMIETIRNRVTEIESGAKPKVSALAAWKENANQLTDAKKEARAAKAAEIQFTDMNGDMVKLYWDGAKYQDKKSKMAQQFSDMKGVFKKKFKKPQNW